jgi:hypothetical protein
MREVWTLLRYHVLDDSTRAIVAAEIEQAVDAKGRADNYLEAKRRIGA